jgi:hypothetical protein
VTNLARVELDMEDSLGSGQATSPQEFPRRARKFFTVLRITIRPPANWKKIILRIEMETSEGHSSLIVFAFCSPVCNNPLGEINHSAARTLGVSPSHHQGVTRRYESSVIFAGEPSSSFIPKAFIRPSNAPFNNSRCLGRFLAVPLKTYLLAASKGRPNA